MFHPPLFCGNDGARVWAVAALMDGSISVLSLAEVCTQPHDARTSVISKTCLQGVVSLPWRLGGFCSAAVLRFALSLEEVK